MPLSQMSGLWSEYRRDISTAEIRSEAAVKTQQGIYQCVATNKHGKSVTSARVIVSDTVPKLAPPQFTKPLNNVWTQLGDSIEFIVEISGLPPPRLEWFRNGEPIDFGDTKFKVGYFSRQFIDVKSKS